MHSFEASTKELKCVITAESIKYGFDILQGIQNENRSERVNEALLQDVVAENEFEKKLDL
ncbi:unnamed protein product [Lathyrus oleraceus]